MNKTEENLLKLCAFDSQILNIIVPFKMSIFREYYWTDNELHSYSEMSLENRHYIQGAISFLIKKTDFLKLRMELLKFSDISLVQTVSGLHLYDEIDYNKYDYYWGVLQKLYKQTDFIQVSIFPTADINKILKAHDFKFYGGTVNNDECYTILGKWTKSYRTSLKCIAVGQLIDLWVENYQDLNSNFYDECLKINEGYLQNGERWKEQLLNEIKINGSFTLFDK